MNAVTTVAAREVRTTMRSKAILISLAVILVVTVAGIGFGAWFMNSSDGDTVDVAVTGEVEPDAFAAADEDVNASAAADRDAAAAAVEDGEVDAAFVLNPDGSGELIAEGTPPAGLSQTASAFLEQHALGQALEASGADQQAFAQAFQPGALEVTDVDADALGTDPSMLVTVMLGVVVIIFLVFLFAGILGGRVTEEKASRIVEIMLATVRPIELLAGKLLGNLIVGVIGAVLFLAAGGVALAVTGLAEDFDFDWSVLPMLIVCFILGMLFFGSLYAAAGSLVARSEDIQSTQMPIMLLMYVAIFAPTFGLNNLDSTLMQVLSWIPPSSLTVAPLQLAAGNWSGWQVAASLAVSAVVTAGILALVARIYRNAILRNGQKVSWTAAIKG